VVVAAVARGDGAVGDRAPGVTSSVLNVTLAMHMHTGAADGGAETCKDTWFSLWPCTLR
jgi:hypothetical protein